MKYLNLLLLATTTLLLFSCKENEKDKISRLVTEWQGKEISFPKEIPFTRYVTDTADYQIPISDYKVLVYVDSVGCTSCKLQLAKWKELITHTDSIAGSKVPFLFFFHSKDYKEIRYLLRRDGFDLPVCIDKDDQLNKLNNFPADITFQTFLLDKDNKVAVIGNPIHNLAIKELYLKHITGTESASRKMIKTTVEVDQTDVNLGPFDKSETRKATFVFKNTGNSPLVILDASTTCGCAAPAFDKSPAPLGGSLRVTVEMTPKDSGFFSETITVKCNTEQSIKLTITGQVR